MMEKCFDAYNCIAPTLAARIAELEEALRIARPLLQETVDSHSDPESPEYNECDTAICLWCEGARKVLDHE